jgi:site-specific DNA recombinase
MAKSARKSIRLIGYCRVSTEDQSTNGVSLEAQRERLEAYAKAHDLALLGVEEDAGVSGGTAPARRPGLARVLAAIRSGEADGLLVLKLDRLSRSTRDILDLVDSSRAQSWRLISVDEHLDTGTAAGRLVVTVLAALAQMEREQVSERTKFALDKIAREGRGRSRFVPFGYRTTDNPERTTLAAGDRSLLIDHLEEKIILRKMVALRENGLGARRIAHALNGDDQRNPRTGKVWSFGQIQGILRTVDRREDALSAG